MPTTTALMRANAIRFLSIDAVQRAKSGHPGMPLGMADIAEVLWYSFMKHHPKHPTWFNRDRFVLSNGHGSMLLYSLLHLTGYDLSLDDLKQFRQLHSKTPGHPEFGLAPGVETTTGPLGQGFANAVGMALAEKHLAARFNRPQYNIVDHYTYCFVGDGCLMEGISHEAASLAGTLGLNKLIVFYDSNGISIDGPVKTWFHDNTAQRFEAYGFKVIPAINGHDQEAIHEAILQAHASKDQPVLIICETTIGFGAPHASGTAGAHGAPLGDAEIALVREALDWPYPPFEIPDSLYAAWDATEKGDQLLSEWQALWDRYASEYPDYAAALARQMNGDKPKNWQALSTSLFNEMRLNTKPVATRKASEWCLNHLMPHLDETFGGSADLTESNCTLWKGATVFNHDAPMGDYLHYGVREFGMFAIMNGIALHGGLLPFGGTFLTFTDYGRNAIRLAAMMRQRVVYVLTHDSIGLGEDGPTHQSIEHIPSLRMIPHLSLWRPADALETAVAWQLALMRDGPTCLVLTRQALPVLSHAKDAEEAIAKGAYVLWQAESNRLPDLIFIATGSEVNLAIGAAEALQKEHVNCRVVSMPSMDVFLSQPLAYQAEVLPGNVRMRIAIEAAVGVDWYRFVGENGRIIGIQEFGVSAPAKDAFNHFGFTVQNVVQVAQTLLVKHVDAL